MTSFWQDVFNLKHFKAYMAWLAKVVGVGLGIIAGSLLVVSLMMWMMIEASEKHYREAIVPQIQLIQQREAKFETERGN